MPRILFVDDEPHVRTSLRRLIQSWDAGYEVVTAASAAEGLDILAEKDIDVVISDVRMPAMDGIEFLTRLRANHQTERTPVLLLTGVADAALKRSAIELGALDFVCKSADPPELEARLHRALRLKAFEDRLVEQNRILEDQIAQTQRMEIAGILAGGAAHDVKNVLAVILGNTELALLHVQDSTARDKLEAVITAAQHAAGLMQQIIGRRHTPFGAQSSCDPIDVIEQSVRLLAVSTPATVVLEFNRPSGAITAAIDADSLQQIAMNIALNGMNAMDARGTLAVAVRPITVSVTDIPLHYSARSGAYVVLEIGDSGCGMAPEVMSRIFEPFFTTRRGQGGTGIGMAIVDRLVRRHHGFISIESTVGKGTTFRVHLPIQ